MARGAVLDRRGAPHQVSGNHSAKVSGSLSKATGSFNRGVTGATAVTDSNAGVNNFSLQLNTNGFNSPLCGSGNTNCAIMQFIYDSPGNVYIQYWLRWITQCPSQTIANNSWTYVTGLGCWINGNAVQPPSPQPITDLAKLYLTGTSSSIQQSAKLEAADGTLWGSPDDGDFLGIGTQWFLAEFNVFGSGGGSKANLTPDPGTTIIVTISVDDGTTSPPLFPPGGTITVEFEQSHRGAARLSHRRHRRGLASARVHREQLCRRDVDVRVSGGLRVGPEQCGVCLCPKEYDRGMWLIAVRRRRA